MLSRHLPLLLAGSALSLTAVAHAGDKYVDGVRGTDSIGAHGGTSWDFPLKTIEEAISRARESDTIHIAKATYEAPSGGYQPKSGQTLLAGYVYQPIVGGSGYYRFEPFSIFGYRATLTGDTSSGTRPTVVVVDNVNEAVRLENLVVTGADGVGGLTITQATVTAADCVFEDNEGSTGAAVGIYLFGVFNAFNCEFKNNSANLQGGAIYAAGGTQSSGFWVQRCGFKNNYSSMGGAIYAHGAQQGGSYLIDNSVFSQNEGYLYGGAIGLDAADSTPMKIINCSFSQNKTLGSFGEGGAIWRRPYDNRIDLTLLNNIVWGNTQDDDELQVDVNGPVTIDHCIIEDLDDMGVASTASFDTDPQFREPSNHDLRLRRWSCAINNGKKSGLGAHLTGLDYWENDRIQSHWAPAGCGSTRGNEIDIGAFEASCTLDVAEPFDVIDLSDLVGFVNAFTAGSSDAEFAPPHGTLDLNDLVAWIAAFETGCD